MSANFSVVESPPYSKVMQLPGAAYQTTKVSLRVDEASLSNSVQQPQITEPRQISWLAASAKLEHNFVFSVCFGSCVDRERLARITVCCQSAQGDKKVQFDVVLGTQCLIENLASPKDSLSIAVAVSPSVGEAANAALGKSEKIYNFSLTVFIAPAVQGEMRTTIIMGNPMQLVPSLSASEKPKRPRGRPPIKRDEENTSETSPPRDEETTTTTTADNKKKRTNDDSSEIEERRRKRMRDAPEAPRFPDAYFAAESHDHSVHSVSFSEIEKQLKKQQQQQSVMPKTPSPPRRELSSVVVVERTPTAIVGQ